MPEISFSYIYKKNAMISCKQQWKKTTRCIFLVRPVHQDSGFLHLMLDQIQSKEDGMTWSFPIPYLLPVLKQSIYKTDDNPDN